VDAHLQISKEEHRNSVTEKLVINQQKLINEDKSTDGSIGEKPVVVLPPPLRNESIQTAIHKSLNDGSPREQSTAATPASAATDSSTKGGASLKCIRVIFGCCWRAPSEDSRNNLVQQAIA
jgi:hypothetical protein